MSARDSPGRLLALRVLQYGSVLLGLGHVFLAGCWFALGQYALGIGSIVLGLMIPGLILTLT